MGGTMISHPSDVKRPKRRTLWVVQQGERHTSPFAFVLAGFGDAWVAAGLASAIGREYTVFALQPGDGTEGLAEPELSARYAEQLLKAQPDGPYCLGGYSAGAVMALAIAIQLRARGREVALVAPLDPMFIRYTRFEHLSYLLLQRVCGAIQKVLPWQPRVLKILAAMFQDEGLDAHLKALAGYRMERYPDEITLFQSSVSFGRSPLLVRQWKWLSLIHI